MLTPDGVGQVNQAGIDHYNKLIDALLAKGEHTDLKVINSGHLDSF